MDPPLITLPVPLLTQLATAEACMENVDRLISFQTSEEERIQIRADMQKWVLDMKESFERGVPPDDAIEVGRMLLIGAAKVYSSVPGAGIGRYLMEANIAAHRGRELLDCALPAGVPPKPAESTEAAAATMTPGDGAGRAPGRFSPLGRTPPGAKEEQGLLGRGLPPINKKVAPGSPRSIVEKQEAVPDPLDFLNNWDDEDSGRQSPPAAARSTEVIIVSSTSDDDEQPPRPMESTSVRTSGRGRGTTARGRGTTARGRGTTARGRGTTGGRGRGTTGSRA